MKKTKYIWLLFVFASILSGQWQALGPYGGNIRPVVVSQTNDNIVYVGSNASPTIIAKSTNG